MAPCTSSVPVAKLPRDLYASLEWPLRGVSVWKSLEKLLDLEATRALSFGHRHNRCAPERENPEAAIEAMSLTSSDPNHVLGTGHKGHWPPTITNSTLERRGKVEPPPRDPRRH